MEEIFSKNRPLSAQGCNLEANLSDTRAQKLLLRSWSGPENFIKIRSFHQKLLNFFSREDRHTDRQMHRLTDAQTDRHTDWQTQTDRHTDWLTQTDRHTDWQTHRMIDTQTDRHTAWQTHSLTDTQTDRHTDWQTHRLTDTQTDRHTDWQTQADTLSHWRNFLMPIFDTFHFITFALPTPFLKDKKVCQHYDTEYNYA